jgi:hypothetical protein
VNDLGHDLRDRLVRLEHGMPSALPLDLEGVVPAPRRSEGWSSRGRLIGLLATAMLAGAMVGGVGVSLLASDPPRAPLPPVGLYRSASPISGPVCVMVELPVGPSRGQLHQTRVWWWPQGPEGCGQRSDFIYVQWVQPIRAQLPRADGSGRSGVTLSLTVELRDGSRHLLAFTFDSLAQAAPDGSVVTFRDADGVRAGVPLVPTQGYDEIEEAPAP